MNFTMDSIVSFFCFSSLCFFLWDIFINKGNRSKEIPDKFAEYREGRPKFIKLQKKVCISIRFSDLRYLSESVEATFKDGTPVRNATSKHLQHSIKVTVYKGQTYILNEKTALA